MLDNIEYEQQKAKEDVLCGKSETIDMDMPAQEMSLTFNYAECEKVACQKASPVPVNSASLISRYLTVNTSSIALIKQKKAIQKDAMEDHIKLLHKYLALYPLFMTGKVTEIVTDEWKRALQELGVEIEFNPHSKELQKKIKRRIQLVAQQVDSYTDELIWKAINQWINWWLTPDEIRESLEKVFYDLSTTRLKTIVRTEAIRYWTFAEQEAWNKSWVVVKKKWWTALDERVCPFCSKMHWKTIWLNESFFEKWDKMDGENWKILDIDYEDVIGSPLHPNCRCDMIPLLEN